MFKMGAKVHFADQTTQEIEITQWELGQLDFYAKRQKLTPSPGRTLLEEMPFFAMRYLAYVAQFRHATGPKPDFDTWDKTVVEVEGGDNEANPTQTAATAEPSAG